MASFTFGSMKCSLVTELFLKTTKRSSYQLYIFPFRYPGTHNVVCSIFFLQCRRGCNKRHSVTTVVALSSISLLILCSPSRSLQYSQSNSMSFYSWKDNTNCLNVIIHTSLHTTVMKLIYHSVGQVTASYEFLSSYCFVAFFTLCCSLP